MLIFSIVIIGMTYLVVCKLSIFIVRLCLNLKALRLKEIFIVSFDFL